MVGSTMLILSEEALDRLLIPLVALAAGSLLGGAFLHMLPEAIDQLGNTQAVWLWFLAGFSTFFVLEQCLHWHHCHRSMSKHRPMGHLILIADGLHNFIGGLAVASAFFIDHRVGLITWTAAAAHEIPQELGDFGILVTAARDRPRPCCSTLVTVHVPRRRAGRLPVWLGRCGVPRPPSPPATSPYMHHPHRPPSRTHHHTGTDHQSNQWSSLRRRPGRATGPPPPPIRFSGTGPPPLRRQ